MKRVQNSSVQSRSSSFLAATTRSTCSRCRNLLSDLSNSRRNPSKSRQRLAHRPQAFLVCGGGNFFLVGGVGGGGFGNLFRCGAATISSLSPTDSPFCFDR